MLPSLNIHLAFAERKYYLNNEYQMYMTKIKVNINKPDPSPETIRKYKDYPSFMRTYQELHTPKGIRKMMYRDPVKLSMIVVFLVLILLWVLSEFESPEPKKEQEKQQTEETSSIHHFQPQLFNKPHIKE